MSAGGGVVVHPGVLLGAAAAIALLSFGLSSWLHATNVEIKHIHKRIDRLVRSKLGGAKRDGRSSPLLTSPQLTSAQHTPSHFPIWASALRGDVELLMEKNRFLEEEMQILRVRLERQVLSTPHTPSRTTSLHSLSHTPPPPISFNLQATPPPPLPPNLPPPPPTPIPPHLSREEWVKAAEELVWCTEEERREKRIEIEEAMGSTPAVLAIIHELFEKSSAATGDDGERRALTQEFGEKLYSNLVGREGGAL